MTTSGNGFTYWINNKECKNFDEWERKIKNIEVTIEVTNLRIDAKTK